MKISLILLKFFYPLFFIFQISNFSIKNNEGKYEHLKKPKYIINSLLLPLMWGIVNMISSITLMFSHSHYKKNFFLAYNAQLIAQGFGYLLFFKYQSLFFSFIIKTVQSLFMIVSIKSVTNKKNVIRLFLGIHLVWIIYEIYIIINFWSLNKKLDKRWLYEKSRFNCIYFYYTLFIK